MCLRQKQVDVIDLARASFGGKLGEQHREIERDRGGEHSIRLRREIRRDRGEDCPHVRSRHGGDVLQRRPG
jgi:hypothetical protein